MILDTIDNFEKHVSLNPNFVKVVEFLQNSNLQKLPLGRNEICGELVFANVVEAKPKNKENAQIEIHRKYIDVHVPLSGSEVVGYTPLKELPYAEFVEADDAALYPATLAARDYFNVKKGEFVIFFPQDGHAPAITKTPLKKIIIKVAMP
ncbi:MAG: YhcH/YjgK/YiaL family protein [Bacteroidaceae bacterium]|nr:YhcH/YjgK/YiaL family protein [Bacteroidaceae bacterium]